MSIFESYLKLGLEHIADLQGYDHILFVLALTIVYPIKHWRKLLILVTAFTVGHSITLILAGLKVIAFSQDLIEFLIPTTIFITSIYNLIRGVKVNYSKRFGFNYLLVLAFGLIHGLGFSNFFVSMSTGGEQAVYNLLAFNIGIELGQLLIVTTIFATLGIFMSLFKVSHRDVNLTVSGATLGLSLVMMIERLPL